MRAFMRAIGLGGLFKNSSGARHSANKHTQALGGRPAMGTLVPVNEIELAMPDAQSLVGRLSRARSRESSIEERPQFLFFCGSDNSGVAAARRTGYQNVAAAGGEFSFENADVLARASIKSPTIQVPTISHRLPVFFAPQQAMLHNFE